MENDLDKIYQGIKNLNDQIFIDGDVIVLYADTANEGSRYEIPRSKCAKADDILRWTYHLSEKTWMDRDMLSHFMFIAATASQVPLHGI
jgi:hypothetical protein